MQYILGIERERDLGLQKKCELSKLFEETAYLLHASNEACWIRYDTKGKGRDRKWVKIWSRLKYESGLKINVRGGSGHARIFDSLARDLATAVVAVVAAV